MYASRVWIWYISPEYALDDSSLAGEKRVQGYVVVKSRDLKSRGLLFSDRGVSKSGNNDPIATRNNEYFIVIGSFFLLLGTTLLIWFSVSHCYISTLSIILIAALTIDFQRTTGQKRSCSSYYE